MVTVKLKLDVFGEESNLIFDIPDDIYNHPDFNLQDFLGECLAKAIGFTTEEINQAMILPPNIPVRM